MHCAEAVKKALAAGCSPKLQVEVQTSYFCKDQCVSGAESLEAVFNDDSLCTSMGSYRTRKIDEVVEMCKVASESKTCYKGTFKETSSCGYSSEIIARKMCKIESNEGDICCKELLNPKSSNIPVGGSSSSETNVGLIIGLVIAGYFHSFLYSIVSE
jgi:hypothetical protein